MKKDIIGNYRNVSEDVPANPGRSVMMELHEQLRIHVSRDPGREVV